jgi:PAS domain S-box-containing protein
MGTVTPLPYLPAMAVAKTTGKELDLRPVPDETIRARILMVDDHPPNLLALEAILSPLDEEIVRANSGEDALRKLLDGDFACILLDVQMPGLDGIETAALIKKRGRNKSTPIIFLTAIAKDPSYIFRGYSQGAVDYLLKPFDPEILRTKVSVFVDLWKKGEINKRQAALLRDQEVREAERRNEVRFRALTDSMPQCVWSARKNGEVTYCNRVWREYAGEDAGVGFFDSLPQSEVQEAQASWKAAITSGTPLEREVRLRRKDGELRWHLCRMVPERDDEGEILGWIATATDIDHQKKVEEAHAALLIREQEARATAEVANRTKDEFLATVSHELRTPLNAILGWTRILRTGATPGGEKLDRALETIERNARAQAQLVEDILDVSRIIAGKLRVQIRDMDLVAVIQSAVEAVRPAAQAKGLEIDLQLPSSLPYHGDPDRLQQVFWNLLSNAIKFTLQGKVTIGASREDGEAVVTMTDTGIGISSDFVPLVFDRFRQADSSITRASGGLGLGLAIVRHLVEVHGGTVKAESEGEGKGSRFTIRLPSKEGRAEAGNATAHQPPRSPARVRALEGTRVLVVDDEADSRELAVELLGSFGAEVITAGSADEAIAAISERPFDVLVSDIGLPAEDGYALIRRVRSEPNGRDVPALALTGYASPTDSKRALEAGYQRHISKPVEPDELIAMVTEMAHHKAAPSADEMGDAPRA